MIFNKVVAKLNAKRIVVKAFRCLEYDLLEYDLFFWNPVYIKCTFHVLDSNKQTNCFIIANRTCVLNFNGRDFCSLNGLSEKFPFNNFNGIVQTILTLSSVCFIMFYIKELKKNLANEARFFRFSWITSHAETETWMKRYIFSFNVKLLMLFH